MQIGLDDLCFINGFDISGEARIGHVYEDDFAERHLKTGDLYRIASGSAFYLVNAAEGQKLYIICSIETSENYGWHWHQHGFRVTTSVFCFDFIA